jgi:signal transduction histidine kinase
MAMAAFGTGGSHSRSPTTSAEPHVLQIYFRVGSLVMLTALAAGALASWRGIYSLLPGMSLWVVAVALTDLLPIQLWGEVSFSLSLPVTLAAGMLLGPLPAAIVSALGSVDPREFRHETTPSRALYNRCQVAVCVWLASSVFHAFGVPVTRWPIVLIPATLALATDFIANLLFVAVPVGMRMRVGVIGALHQLLAEAPFEYVAGYFCLGSIAILQATMVESVGMWGLFVCLAPLVLARKMFLQAQQLGRATSTLERKNLALRDVTKQISDERRDERHAIAGELHDGVLPPLLQVHLMGQVIRQDLNSGRLLDLDEDLPALLSATEVAQSVIRDLLGDLRRSPIGVGGLATTIRMLAEELESHGSPPFALRVDDVEGSHAAQLLVFQVAREAMTNAAHHSKGSQIEVHLWQDGGLRLIVSDDGIGFDKADLPVPNHFGLNLIAERVEAAGGSAVIDSYPGGGTRVVALIPLRIDDLT